MKTKAAIQPIGSSFPGLLFEDGTRVFPISDPAMNSWGIFFGVHHDNGDPFYLFNEGLDNGQDEN
ncbi:MAG: hypothetical protein K8R77_06115 [Anaerolineaceae bacterium]|nr:hypothetical protein [Anaerolineaceae bacterium]